MPLLKITDIFFDLDHTLWDFEANSALAFETIFRKNYLTIQIKDFMAEYVPINHACWKLYQNDKISREELRYNRFKYTFDALEYAISNAEIQYIVEDYIQLLPESNRLFDGAIEVLEYLERKYTLHIITNGFAEVQFRKIKNSNIERFFKTITHSEIAGVKKPNPIIYQYALTLAQTTKENSIMIGDCLEADVQGALNAGLDAIFFNDKKLEVTQNIKQVNHLLELKKYL